MEIPVNLLYSCLETSLEPFEHMGCTLKEKANVCVLVFLLLWPHIQQKATEERKDLFCLQFEILVLMGKALRGEHKAAPWDGLS